MANDPFPYDFGRLDIGAESTLNDESGNYRTTNAAVLDRGSLEIAALRPGAQTAADYSQGVIVGATRGTLSTRHELHGWSSDGASIAAAPTASYAVATPSSITLAEYVAAALGNFVGGGYVSTTFTGSTTSIIKVGDGHAASFQVGQAVTFDAGASEQPRYPVAWIKEIDATGDPGEPDELDLLATLPTAATGSGAKLYGSITCFQKTAQPYYDGATKGWSLKYFGNNAADLVIATGAQPSAMAFEFADSELCAVTITWSVSSFSEEGSGGGAVVGAYSYPAAEPFIGAWVTFSDASSPSYANSYRIQGLSVDLGIESIAVIDPSQESGVAGFQIVRRNPTVTFSVYRDVDEEVDDFVSQTGKTFAMQIGSEPGRMIALLVPNALITSYPTAQNLDGMVGATVTVEAGNYTGDTGSAADTNPIDTNFRIAFL